MTMTHWAMTFFGDAQLSKQRREEGGVIETRDLEADRAWGGRGSTQENCTRVSGRVRRTGSGHHQGGGLGIWVSAGAESHRVTECELNPGLCSSHSGLRRSLPLSRPPFQLERWLNLNCDPCRFGDYTKVLGVRDSPPPALPR